MSAESPLHACQAATLVDLLERRVANRPAQTAFVFLDENDEQVAWTYQELSRRVAAAAAAIGASAGPGDRALLVYPPGLEFIAAFLGCLRAGVLPVPATYPKPRRPLPRLDAIAADCQPTLGLSTEATLATMQLSQQSPQVRDLPWQATDRLSSADSMPVVRCDPESPAFLQYTSGSTSQPRGVVVTHANLMHNLELIRQGFELDVASNGAETVRGVFWLPAYHDMGLIGGVLTPLYVGGTSHLIAPAAFLRQPLVWLEWLSRTGATVSGAPNFAYDLCVEKATPEKLASLDLGRWEIAFCGAEPVCSRTLQRFAETFAPVGFRAEAHYPCYGLAEATLMVTGGRRAAPPRRLDLDRRELSQHRVVESAADDAQTLVGCGRNLGNQQLKIVDQQTREVCPEDAVGEIWVRGNSVARGYWKANGDDAFGGQLATGEGGYLRTGDLGFLHAGELFVTGRVKDVIIIRGRNHYPQDIERTAQRAHPAVDLGAAFSPATESGSDELVVVHQVTRTHRRSDLEEVLQAVRTAVVEQHEIDPEAILLIQPATLPLTSSGKVQRRRCRAMFEAGELQVLAEFRRSACSLADGGATPEEPPGRPEFLDRLDHLSVEETTLEVQRWMMAWLAHKLSHPVDDLSPAAPFAALGVDSMTSVELALEFEDVLGLRLAPAVALSYPTPAELSGYLAEQLQADAAADG